MHSYTAKYVTAAEQLGGWPAIRARNHALVLAMRAGLELPVVDLASGPRIRLAAQLYNHIDQVMDLPAALASHGVGIAR